MQLTLEGKTKDQVAIERMQAFEPPEGYYLAFSGGKDSVTLLALAKMAGVKFDAHYHLTTVDPPEVVQFIKGTGVEIVRPPKTMWQLAVEPSQLILPTRTRRWCCEQLKERGGNGRLVLTGIRWAESARRSQRKMLEYSRQDPSKRFLHAVIDWTDDDVWQFIRENRVPYCRLYDEGFKRLGCVLCPMVGGWQLQRQIERWPKIVQAWRNAANRIAEVKKVRGMAFPYKSGDDYFNWWLSREGLKDSQQATFYDCTVPFSD
jgi:phosphoadenosine phosphosulfate reductase